MANATPSLELTSAEQSTVKSLALTMKAVTGVLLALGALNVIGGGIALAAGSLAGVVGIIEGAVTALLGLIMLASSTDAAYMVQTKYTPIHFTHALRNLTVFYQAQLGLAIFLILATCVRFFVG
jgi:hypothetical protein